MRRCIVLIFIVIALTMLFADTSLSIDYEGIDDLYIYDQDASDEFTINPDAIHGITSVQSASSTIYDEIASMTSGQRNSGDALDKIALFIENATRVGASKTVSGEVSLSEAMLSDLAETANEILIDAEDSLVYEDVRLLRHLRKNIMLRTDETEDLQVIFPDDVSTIGFDNITIEADFASVTLNRDRIQQGGGIELRKVKLIEEPEEVSEEPVIEVKEVGFWDGVSPLDFWSVLVVALIFAAWSILAIFNHRFRAWVVPTFCVLAIAGNVYTFLVVRVNLRAQLETYDVADVDDGQTPEETPNIVIYTDEIEIIMSEGVWATVSLPATGDNKDYLMLLNENNEPQYSKYNPVTDMVDTRIRASGKYTLKEYTVSFVDIEQKSDLMKEAISLLASRSIMTGTTDGFFYPDKPLTRAELVSAVVRAFDMLDPDTESSFTDVSKSDWYYTAVATAEREHIISGFEDNTFRGNIDIPKDQLVAVSANTLSERMGYIVPEDVEAELMRYIDRDELTRWSRDMIALATKTNILIYRTDNMFAPGSIMTRGDAAIVLYRVFNKVW